MKKKKTLEEVVKICEDNNLKFMDDYYDGNDKRYNVYCLKHKEIHLAEISNIKSGHGLKCCRNNFHKLLLEDVKKRTKEFGFEFKDNFYGGRHFKHSFFCLKHKETHLATFANINRGQGLKCCGEERSKNYADSLRYSIEEVKKICLKNGFKFLDPEYINMQFKHNFLCLKHNKILKSRFANIIGGHGLMCCSIASSIERLKNGVLLTKTNPHKLVIKLLNKLKIKHESEKTIFPFSIDEYCPEYNLCIEVQGDYWHCNPKVYKNGPINEVQKHGVKRDKRKKRFLTKKGYNILFLWEKDIKENIEKVKEKIIKKINKIKGK